MTLQNGLVFGEKAYLWSDTAFFDGETGELLCHDTKAMQGLYWPWAGVFSCVGDNPHEIAFDIGNSWPMDVPSVLAATSNALRRYAAKGFLARVLLATWQDRPQLWLVASDDAGGDGAFVPTEAVHYLNTGDDLPEVHEAAGRGLNPRRMARVIDAQLAEPPVQAAGPIAGGRVQYGGNVVEMEFSRDGVESRVLRAIAGFANQ